MGQYHLYFDLNTSGSKYIFLFSKDQYELIIFLFHLIFYQKSLKLYKNYNNLNLMIFYEIPNHIHQALTQSRRWILSRINLCNVTQLN
jgi:hypothetical protein